MTRHRDPYQLTFVDHFVDAAIGTVVGLALGVLCWLATLWLLYR